MTLNLEETEKLARAALAMSREYYHDVKVFDVPELDDFMEHMDPERTLVLIARIRELEAAQASWGNEFSAVCMAKQERDELAAYAEGLKAALAGGSELGGVFWREKALQTPPPAFLQSQREKMERVKQAITTLFETVKHGDETHQVWLNAKLTEHFAETLKLLGEA